MAFDDIIRSAARQYGVPESLAFGLFSAESGFKPDAVGPVTSNGQRAVGIAQFMPATAKEMNIDPTKPEQAIPGAMAYLRKQFDTFGSWPQALTAYNWGPGNLHIAGGRVDRAPAETRAYVEKVQNYTGAQQPAAAEPDFSRYFPSGGEKEPDYSRYFPVIDTTPPKSMQVTPAQAQAQQRAAAFKAEAESRPWYEQALGGLGTGTMKMSEGIRGMIPQPVEDFMTSVQTKGREMLGMPPARPAPSVQELSDMGGATGWTTAGDVAAPVLASLAMPQGVVAGGLSQMGLRAGPVFQAAVPRILDTGLTTGLFSFLTTPGTIEDRSKAAGMSAATSMALPAATGMVQAGRRMATRGGARVGAGEAIRREIGGQADDLVGTLRSPYPAKEVLGVRPTSAQVTKNPSLQGLETGSRVKRAELWRPVDEFNAGARWAALSKQARSPDELAEMINMRAAVTTPMRENALTSVSFGIRSAMGDVTDTAKPLLDKLDDLAKGATRPNKDVQTLVKYVTGEFDQGVTPAQLYTVRKSLTDGVKAAPTSELSQAARAARAERTQIIGLIDDVLDDLSGGQWTKYMRRYANESTQITSTEAMQKVQGAIGRGTPEGVPPAMLGTSAAYKTVGNLRDRFGQKMFGSRMLDRLTPEDRKFLGILQDDLYRSSGGITAQATRGSPTAPLSEAAKRADFLSSLIRRAKVPAGGLSDELLDGVTRRAEEEIAFLLQNPDAMARALEAAKRADLLRQGAGRAGMMTGAGAATYR